MLDIVKKINKNKYLKFIEKKKEKCDYHNIIDLKEFTDDINILIGPNGTGKSMTLLALEEDLKNKKINYVRYTTKHNDIVNSTTPWASSDEYVNALVCAFHSEGERMDDSINSWANKKLVPTLLNNTEPLYVIFDEIDSGLSFDRLKIQLEDLCSIIKYEKAKNRELHYIFTCNSFEMYEVLTDYSLMNKYTFKTIFVPTKEEISLITDYKEFRSIYEYYYSKFLNANQD